MSELGVGSVLKEHIVLVRELGRGGMGVVWLATHRALDAHVVVKVLESQGDPSEEARARFAREARATARIESVHVVRVFDVGHTAGGKLYIVMEYLRGRDLKDRLEREGPLSTAETSAVVDQVCDALERAHAQGIVHRDLKPANVFLLEGARTFVKLLDFGIAKLGGDQGRMLTGTDALVGTPYYMSPEQFIDPRQADHRSDLWSLAVVAYACLTGTLPFRGETVGALAVTVHEGVFTAPSQIAPSVPNALDAWFSRALAVEPERRFQDARALATAFAQACASPAIAAPQVHAGAQLGDETAAPLAATNARPKPRSRKLSIAAVTAVAVLGAAVTGWFWVVRPRLGGRPTPAKKPDAALVAACEAFGGQTSFDRDRDGEGLNACSKLCEERTPAACVRIGDLLSKSPAEHERALAAYQRACELGDGRACGLAGTMVGRGRGAPKDKTRGAELHARGCEIGDLDACTELGRGYAVGIGVARDGGRALEIHSKGCEKKHLVDCDELGVLYLTGVGTARNDERAAGLFKEACDAGTLRGCAHLAELYSSGRGVPRDHRAAVTLSRRVCEAGEHHGCAILLTIAPGERSREDAARELPAVTGRCDAGDADACRYLAWKYSAGDGVAKDDARALSLFQRACDDDDMLACYNAGTMYLTGVSVPMDATRAFSFFQRSCKDGLGHGCLELGHSYAQGRGVPRDVAIAASLYGASCDLDRPEACLALGYFHYRGDGIAKDVRRSVEPWEKGCAVGSPEACDFAGQAITTGQGVPKDEGRGAAFFVKGCDANFMRSCFFLAELHESGGNGKVKRDPALAKTLYQKACDGGLNPGCRRAKRIP